MLITWHTHRFGYRLNRVWPRVRDGEGLPRLEGINKGTGELAEFNFLYAAGPVIFKCWRMYL